MTWMSTVYKSCHLEVTICREDKGWHRVWNNEVKDCNCALLTPRRFVNELHRSPVGKFGSRFQPLVEVDTLSSLNGLVHHFIIPSPLPCARYVDGNRSVRVLYHCILMFSIQCHRNSESHSEFGSFGGEESAFLWGFGLGEFELILIGCRNGFSRPKVPSERTQSLNEKWEPSATVKCQEKSSLPILLGPAKRVG
jgi:hypothetical protein